MRKIRKPIYLSDEELTIILLSGSKMNRILCKAISSWKNENDVNENTMRHKSVLDIMMNKIINESNRRKLEDHENSEMEKAIRNLTRGNE